MMIWAALGFVFTCVLLLQGIFGIKIININSILQSKNGWYIMYNATIVLYMLIVTNW
jgi:hypothetical protein